MAEIAERPKSVSARAKAIGRRIYRHENAVLGMVLAAVFGAMAVVTKGQTLEPGNGMNILFHSAITGVAALGQLFVILSAGIDLSVGGLGLMIGMLSASMMTSEVARNVIGHPMSPYMVIPIMMLVGAGFGAINGAAVSRIGMPALIVTFSMWQITKGIAFQLYMLGGGGASIAYQPQSLAFFGSGAVAGVPVPAIIYVAVAVIGYLVLEYTSFGRRVYATGGNATSAYLSGINVKNTQLMVYIISGFLASISGVLITARGMGCSMRALVGLELSTIAAVVIGGVSLFGGRGTLIGAVLGITIISVVDNAMSVMGARPPVVDIVKGAIIFAAVAIDFIRRR